MSESLQRAEPFQEIVTQSPIMHQLFHCVKMLGPTSYPVLITGESGVGKELFAHALHQASRRAGPFVPVNIAGLDDTVIADTLFGHLKGAYTGADRNRPGLIEKAAGGTLFLDEIGDLSLRSQIKLLRLLQEYEYMPLGSDSPKRCEARILLATHQDIWTLQAEGRFRTDLYYRLSAHQIRVPSLRERREDIPLLIDHFLSAISEDLGKPKAAVPSELYPLLSRYGFPGNVRELQSMVLHVAALYPGPVLPLAPWKELMREQSGGLTLPPAPQTEPPTAQTSLSYLPELPTLKEAAQLLIAEALRRSGGNQTLAARLLGISQPALSKRLKASSESTASA